jgi:anti-anti-sigma factor
VKTLDVTVRHQPRTSIIDLQGEINSFAEERLNSAYADAERHNPELIVLNFSAVNYINSTGIALIVSLLRKARTSKRRLVACSLSDHYVEIFQITRLADFMGIYVDEASALNAKEMADANV